MTIKGILYFVIPALGNKATINILRKKINNNGGIVKEKLQTPLSMAENPDVITNDNLKKQYDDVIKAKDNFEDKAKATIACVTISVSLIMGASGMLNTITSRFDYPLVHWWSYILFVYAVLSMITAAIMAIKVLADENKIYCFPADCPREKERETYDRCIGQNVTQNYIRNSYIFSAYECIRNALVCLFVIMAIAVMPMTSTTTSYKASVSSQRDYLYSEYAINALSKYDPNKIKTIVENVLPSMQIKVGETYSIVDHKNSLFIRLQVIENGFNILSIEEISFEQ